MSLYSSGAFPSRSFFGWVKILLKIAIFSIILVFGVYMLFNFSKYGSFFEKNEYANLELVNLLSFGSFYNEKKVCTSGYYVNVDKISVLKVSLDEDEFTRSVWINLNGNKIIGETILRSQGRFVLTEVCGQFEFRRAGEFGIPSAWNQQITLDSHKILGPIENLD